MNGINLDTWSPLFSSIVMSSVWDLDPASKVVWVTMLAVKDRVGFVSGTVPGLARLAKVTPDECRKALALFEAPDPDSRSKENAGIKIEAVEGGWFILGHERFQKQMREVSTKIGNAKRQRKRREKILANHQGHSRPQVGEPEFVKAYAVGDESRMEAIVERNHPTRTATTELPNGCVESDNGL